jgi:Uma2 family endonuclease
MATTAPKRRKAPRAARSPKLPLHRLTVDQYERIVAAGILDDPGRVELIDGYMVDKMAKHPGHSHATLELFMALNPRLPAGWSLREEEPVRIPKFDEPAPDIAVVRGTNADYRRRLPTAADVALLVEVSQSTLSQDRGVKRAAYARAGIAVYWIVNLIARQVEVYTRPTPDGRYRSRKDYKPGQLVPVSIAGHVASPIAVNDILP